MITNLLCTVVGIMIGFTIRGMVWRSYRERQWVELEQSVESAKMLMAQIEDIRLELRRLENQDPVSTPHRDLPALEPSKIRERED